MTQRMKRIREIRDAAVDGLHEVDAVLTRFQGRRLSEALSSIGTLPVETTAAGIWALAALVSVKSIMEDQPVSRIDPGVRANH